MRWGVLWNFAGDGNDQWLDDIVEPGHHRFVKIPTRRPESNWHERTSPRTSLNRWLRSGAGQLGDSDVDGVITVFPPLAVTTGLRNRLRRRRLKHVAWAFNLGHHPRGWKRLASSVALANVDRIIVHSSGEVAIVRDLFGLDQHQVEFVPLQGPDRPVLAGEDTEQPFIVAIGSANRDYRTLIEALRITGLPAKIVASPRLIEEISPPPRVEVLTRLTPDDCLRLAQQARICVTPLADPSIASGQVTIIDALTMGRPVVTTRSIGTVDYIADGSTGLLVAPGDAEGMAKALQKLWDDDAKRRRLAEAGRQFARSTLSDPAIARRLVEVLDAVEKDG